MFRLLTSGVHSRFRRRTKTLWGWPAIIGTSIRLKFVCVFIIFRKFTNVAEDDYHKLEDLGLDIPGRYAKRGTYV